MRRFAIALGIAAVFGIALWYALSGLSVRAVGDVGGARSPSAEGMLSKLTVLDGASGRPVRASIRSPSGEFETSANGRLEFSCRQPSTIVASAPGFFDLSLMPACGEQTVRLEPGVTVVGSVRTERSPATGARVECDRGATSSGSAGEFQILCAPGKLTLRARHAAGSADLVIGERAGGSTVEGVVLTLSSATTSRILAGRVVESDGAPIPAGVVFLPANGAPFAIDTSDGIFQQTVSQDSHTVAAIAQDGRVTSGRVPRGTGAFDLELRMQPGSVLRGRLEGDFESASVVALPDSPTLTSDELLIRPHLSLLKKGNVREAKISADRFEIAGLTPGKYRLMARSRHASGTADATVPTDRIVTVVMTSSPATLAVHFTGLDTGKGTLEVRRRETGALKVVGFRNSEAVIQGIAPGEFELVVRPLNGPVPPPRIVLVESGENSVDWSIPSGFVTIAGRVIDASTGSPVQGASVSVPRREAYAWNRITSYEVLSDPGGEFKIEVADSQSMLFVWHELYAPQVISATEAASIRLNSGKPSVQVKIPSSERAPN